MAFLDIVGDSSGVFQIRGNVGAVSASVSPKAASQQARGNIGTVSDIVAVDHALVYKRLIAGSILDLVSSEFVVFTVPSAGGGGLIKVWLAGSWQEKPLKYWSGGAWVQKPVKYWSGTAWTLS